jgi:hypothetical protein
MGFNLGFKGLIHDRLIYEKNPITNKFVLNSMELVCAGNSIYIL